MDSEDLDLRSNNAKAGRVETENTRNSVEGLPVETAIVIESEEKACHAEKEKDSEVASSDSNQDEHRSIENLSVGVSVEDNLSEAQYVTGDDDMLLSMKVGELGLVKETVEESKVGEADKLSCVIDINCGSAKSCGSDKWDGESVCRICHLSSDQSPDRRSLAATSVSDLIQLGCGCKDDLGVTHYQCAEAWFKLKGNRVCEICGETAKNVTGVGDEGFMEEWNETVGQSASNSSEQSRGCWRGQPFCNFLMAFLVIAFVLPWFFRVNMF